MPQNNNKNKYYNLNKLNSNNSLNNNKLENLFKELRPREKVDFKKNIQLPVEVA